MDEKNDDQVVEVFSYQGSEQVGDMIVTRLKENGIEANYVHYHTELRSGRGMGQRRDGVIHVFKKDESKARELIEEFWKEREILWSEEGEEWKDKKTSPIESLKKWEEKENGPQQKTDWLGLAIMLIVLIVFLFAYYKRTTFR